MSTFAYSGLSDRDLLNYKKKIRRQREICKKVILAVIAFVVVLFFTFSYNAITSQANEDTSDVTYKYFTSFEIEQGDSLWSIAEAHIDYDHYDSIQDYIDEVVDINNLKSESIKSGQCIIIPYFSNIYH